MRATDQSYYNIKRLHVWMAASSLALLAVTVWMLVADHRRPWKQYQRTFRDRVEPWITEARIEQQRSGQFLAREAELAAALEESGRAVPQRALIERFRAEVEQDAARRDQGEVDFDRLGSAYDDLAAEPGGAARGALMEQLEAFVSAAALRRQNAQRRLRFRRAEFAEARSYYEAGVGEGLPPAKLEKLQRQLDGIRADVDRLAAELDDATVHHAALRQIVGEMTREEDAARTALADHRATLKRLGQNLAGQRPSFGRQLLQLPLIDAWGRPLAVDQIWLPELTIDYNFRQVARFDRCVTCHQGIDKVQPGRPSEPAIGAEEVLTVELATPSQAPGQEAAESATQNGDDGNLAAPSLQSVYGLVLAEGGILDDKAATVQRVLPAAPAADARLSVGDVIAKVSDVPLSTVAMARKRLLEEVEWGRPLALEIRRGLPHPYCSHPRPDLFVGSMSPHPMTEFGCTICHDGQGSATEFTWASHTPNHPADRMSWQTQHGWFANRHWDFPMLPERFAQSRCLKCHHEVTDLEPSRRFPEPPAAKLLAGYQLVRQFGCFGCHEINGFGDAGRSIGPDMRLEPNYAEAAQGLLAGEGLTEPQRLLARQVIDHPEQPEPRRQLADSIRSGDGPLPRKGESQVLIELLAAEEPRPGTLRKVGPSLRDTAGKLDAAFLADRIQDPAHFLPSTRMPRFYGLHEHLEDQSLAEAERFEAVEIRAIAAYLTAVSRPVEPLAAPAEVTEAPSPQRGKRLFQLRGCLACHKHGEFPEGQATQGPDLTNVGLKYSTEGADWLASWIRDPVRHAPRTLMPNTMLEPVPLAAGGERSDAGRPAVTDPAADVAAFLLLATDWQPQQIAPLVESDLDELARLHLSKSLPGKVAKKYLREGIPASAAGQLQGDATVLAGEITTEKKLQYVGRRTIRQRGCYGCHDVPGFEDAGLIAPALSDWGRKQESLLAFGQIHRHVAQGDAAQQGRPPAETIAEDDPGRGFFLEALLAHRREGFIWQKLRAPRSFDFKTARNKGYSERLTMGRFELTDEQREAIITFVLGLVAEPPAQKYVYRGDARRRAIAQGRKVLDKYACAACHTLEMERWTFEFDPDEFEDPPAAEDFDFLAPRIPPEQVAASLQADGRGMFHAEVVGMPQVDGQGELLLVDDDVDEDDKEIYLYAFTLWEPAAINGQVCTVGGADVLIWDDQITGKRAPVGGTFARLLYPVALAEGRAAGSSVAGPEAWGWVPPPLVHEGAKVQPAWLHDYLLTPTAIRPAAVLRMPRYNMSAAEAGQLVDYFAAVSGVDFPYSSHRRNRFTYLGEEEERRRLDDAMKILVDATTYCAKCHLIGDYSPGGEVDTVLGPNVAEVGRRVRPEHVRRWLANPKSILPYTGMPINFPPTGDPLGQDLFRGDSVEQLDAVMDLLLNYDWYMKRRTPIRQLVRPTAGAESAGSD